MKKVQIILGSPRKKGNTNILSEKLISNLNNDKISAEIMYLYDYELFYK